MWISEGWRSGGLGAATGTVGSEETVQETWTKIPTSFIRHDTTRWREGWHSMHPLPSAIFLRLVAWEGVDRSDNTILPYWTGVWEYTGTTYGSYSASGRITNLSVNAARRHFAVRMRHWSHRFRWSKKYPNRLVFILSSFWCVYATAWFFPWWSSRLFHEDLSKYI